MNQQVFPQSTYPLTGDIASAPGRATVTVTGLQNVHVSSQSPQDGQIQIFDQNTQQYVPGDPIVSGPDAIGVTPTRNPVQIGGQDDSNKVRELRVDSSGTLVSTNIETLLKLLLNEQRKTNLLLMDATGNNFDDDGFIGDM